MRLYAFGDRFECEKLRNLVVDEAFRTLKSKTFPPPSYLKACLEVMPASSKYCKLMIERCARISNLADPKSCTQPGRSEWEGLPAEVLVELFLVARDNVHPARPPDYEVDFCTSYHDHGDDDDRASCPSNRKRTSVRQCQDALIGAHRGRRRWHEHSNTVNHFDDMEACKRYRSIYLSVVDPVIDRSARYIQHRSRHFPILLSNINESEDCYADVNLLLPLLSSNASLTST